MKVRKEHIIVVLFLLIMLGLVGAVYQFYYVPRSIIFAENKEKEAAYESAIGRMQTQFQNTKPSIILEEIERMKQPLTDQLEGTSKAFNLGDMFTADPVPEGQVARFYYEEQYRALFLELQKLMMNHVPYVPVPQTNFGVPSPDELLGLSPTNDDVMNYVRWIRFGTAMLKMMMDSKALAVYDFQLWPPRQGYDGSLDMRTVGFMASMRLSDFCNFIDSLRTNDRYYTVESLSLRNQALASATEPIMLVQIVFSMANYVKPGETPPGAAPDAVGGAPGGMPPMTGMLGGSLFGGGEASATKKTDTPPAETSMWGKTKSFFSSFF